MARCADCLAVPTGGSVKSNRDIAADIPPRLREADDILHRYGRWAKDRIRLHRCGSAERAYRAPQDDIDREPKPVLMHIDMAMACQRALARVPERERIVLSILYVPHRLPAQVLLNRMRIPPRLSRERHVQGLRMFDNLFGMLYSRPHRADRELQQGAFRQPEASPGMTA